MIARVFPSICQGDGFRGGEIAYITTPKGVRITTAKWIDHLHWRYHANEEEEGRRPDPFSYGFSLWLCRFYKNALADAEAVKDGKLAPVHVDPSLDFDYRCPSPDLKVREWIKNAGAHPPRAKTMNRIKEIARRHCSTKDSLSLS